MSIVHISCMQKHYNYVYIVPMYEKHVGSHGQFVGMHVSSYKVKYMMRE